MMDARYHGNSEGTHTSMGFHEGKDVIAGILEGKRLQQKLGGKKQPELYYYGHSMSTGAFFLAPVSTGMMVKQNGAPQQWQLSKEGAKGYQKAYKEAMSSLSGVILDSAFARTEWGYYKYAHKILSQPFKTLMQWPVMRKPFKKWILPTVQKQFIY